MGFWGDLQVGFQVSVAMQVLLLDSPQLPQGALSLLPTEALLIRDPGLPLSRCC